METSPTFDLAVPVRYTLTHREAAHDQVDLVLDLFRGAVQIHTCIVASVDREQAVLVMAKCRRYLQLRGVDAAPSAALRPPSAKPALSIQTSEKPLPTAAKPTITPMRPAPGIKPMTVPAKPGVLGARTSAIKPVAVRWDQTQEARMPNPAVAAFDCMFLAG